METFSEQGGGIIWVFTPINYRKEIKGDLYGSNI